MPGRLGARVPLAGRACSGSLAWRRWPRARSMARACSPGRVERVESRLGAGGQGSGAARACCRSACWPRSQPIAHNAKRSQRARSGRVDSRADRVSHFSDREPASGRRARKAPRAAGLACGHPWPLGLSAQARGDPLESLAPIRGSPCEPRQLARVERASASASASAAALARVDVDRLNQVQSLMIPDLGRVCGRLRGCEPHDPASWRRTGFKLAPRLWAACGRRVDNRASYPQSASAGCSPQSSRPQLWTASRVDSVRRAARSTGDPLGPTSGIAWGSAGLGSRPEGLLAALVVPLGLASGRKALCRARARSGLRGVARVLADASGARVVAGEIGAGYPLK